MNGSASIPADDMVSAGQPMPCLAEATPLEGRRLRIRFHGGEARVVDLTPILESRRFFIPLRDDDALFRSLRISEYRDSIEWNGDIDLSAVWLAKLPSVEFDNLDFRNAMDHLGMTLDGMASALEISRRQVADYRKDKPIPRHIGLATRYLVEHGDKSL